MRQVANFVEHQRTIVGGLDLARRRSCGAGERAFFVTEQLAFQQIVGDGGTVDGHETLTTSRGSIMYRTGQQFLTSSAFAK